MKQTKSKQLHLRFPKFKKNWTEKELGSIGETYNGLTGKTKEDFGKGKPYIQYKQIFDNSKIDISKFEFVEITKDETQNKVKFGDVFFTVSSETPNEIGTASVLLDNVDELYLNSFCFGYRPNSFEILNPNFARYLFRSEYFRNNIIKLAQGSTRYNMSKVQLMKLKVKLPDKQEQEKIAGFLSAIDDKIDNLQQQLEKMKSYKKGIMQGLFYTDSDEKIGGGKSLIFNRLRFKDKSGKNYPDWEVKKLKDIGHFIGGGTPSTKNFEFWCGNIPWLSSSDLSDENIYQIKTTRYITVKAIQNSATKLIPKKSILIVSRVGVGKIAVNEVDVCTSQDFTNLILKSGNYIFLAYLIKLKTNQLLGFNQGTSIKGFVKSDLENTDILFPCLEEQTKIANFLSSVDDKINAVNQQIEKSTTWKKGLLQKMFV